MPAITTMPTHMIIAWSENARLGRRCATIQPTAADTTMASPPIVGVPCFIMWCSGPLSSLPRIGCPVPRVRKKVMR